MDFNKILTENFVVVVVVACLAIGYIIKHSSFLKKIPNDDIPAIMAAVGAILNAVVSGPSVDTIVYGAFMGLASTGLHQAFKTFVEGAKEDETLEEHISK